MLYRVYVPFKFVDETLHVTTHMSACNHYDFSKLSSHHGLFPCPFCSLNIVLIERACLPRLYEILPKDFATCHC